MIVVMKRIIQFGVVLTLALVGFIYVSTPDFILASDDKVWIKTGGEVKNDVASINQTVDLGRSGIQIEIVQDKERFFLYREEEVEGKLNKITDEGVKELFTSLGDKKFNLWIRIRDLSFANMYELSSGIKKFFLEERLFGKAFIETQSLLFSMILRLQGVPVVYWYDVKKSAVRNIPNQIFLLPLQVIFRIPSITYDVKNEGELKGYSGERMVFTVNDEKISKYYCDENIKVILIEYTEEEIEKTIEDCSILRE